MTLLENYQESLFVCSADDGVADWFDLFCSRHRGMEGSIGMGKKVFQLAKVEDNRAINPDVFELTLSSPDIAAAAMPGQFVMLGVNSNRDPLLKRPYSIAGAEKTTGKVRIIYRVVGRGTECLSKKQPGDCLEIIGPLGHGFDVAGKKTLLVGGGMGLAPLLFAAQTICPGSLEVLAGGKNKQEMFWKELFQPFCNKIHIATDDGTMGTCGTCVDILPHIVNHGDFDAILTCGPLPMLRGVAAFTLMNHIPCQVSLEQHMACGFGACLTCTCATKDGENAQVCKHGPVFKAEEVDLC